MRLICDAETVASRTSGVESDTASHLFSVLRQLAPTRELPEVAAGILRAARQLLAADGAAWIQLERDDAVVLLEDSIAPVWKERTIPLRAGGAASAMRNGKAWAVDDTGNDPRLRTDVFQSTFVKSLAAAPLAPENASAAIEVYWAEARHISAGELQTLQAVADCAAVALSLLELKRTVEQASRLRSDEMALASRELETFSFTVSHDLRAPVRAIEAYAELMLDPRTGAAEARGYINRILNSAQQMNLLIDDTLKLARISSAALKRSRVNLSGLAAEIAIVLRAQDARRPARITVHPHLVAEGDPELLRIALEELLANAWKFTARSADAEIEFGKVPHTSPPEYFVRDNGVGFDAHAAHQLFEPFQRFHPATEFKGHGIGLAAVRRIVTKHGGRLWVESVPGRGATFSFTLA